MADESAGGIFTGERLVADDPLFVADFARHLVAYEFAQQLGRDKNVLDAGCGDGYGTELMARTARRALGVDRSADTIGVALGRYRRGNLHYRVCPLELLGQLDESFDLICNFQVIEHLRDPRPFLRAARSVLAPDGVLVITTPNRANSFVENPYHVHEYLADELTAILGEVFANVQMQGVCGNQKVMDFERARGVHANRILRFDPLGLRNLLPRQLIEWAYPKLARLVRRNINQADDRVASITQRDYQISDSSEGSLDLLALCRL